MSASAVGGGLKSGLKSGNSQGVPSRSVTIADGDAGGQEAPSRPRERHGGQGKAKEEISLGSLSSAAQKDAAAAFSSGRRARPSLSRGSDSSRQSGDELLKSKGHYANATGMIAASTQAGGKGVNCLKFQSIRYDGLDQKDVIKDLEDAVEEMSGNPATFKTKSPNLLSPFETIQHRANDLSTWYGVETAPDHYSAHRDPLTGMTLVRYDGEFDESEDGRHIRQGHGTVRAVNGIKYEGLFENGMMHGKGKVVFPSGNVWQGEFDKGRMHGEGVFTWSKPLGWSSRNEFKKKYMGMLDDGKMISVGRPSTYIYNKHVYEGEFVDGCAHGKGVMLWPDGRYYDGEWRAGKPHGEGKVVMPDGESNSGFFEPCNARWYLPVKIDKNFWPGHLDEAELLRVERKLAPAQERMR